jgi:putative transposase
VPTSFAFTQHKRKKTSCDGQWAVYVSSKTKLWLLELKLGKKDKNREKARLKVAKIHAKIKDTRTDFLHKLTTDLVRNNNSICIEDLAIRNMVRNRKLARSISNAEWGELFRQLEDKCECYERQLVTKLTDFLFLFFS